MGGRRLPAVLAFLIGLCLMGGVAAGVAKSPPSFKACATSKGVLELATTKGKCARGSTAVRLDAVGPRGSQGPKGPKGDTGPTGVGHTYTNLIQDQAISGDSNVPTNVTTLFPTVPDGSYQGIVTVTNQAHSETDTNYDVFCMVVEGGPAAFGGARFFGDGYKPGTITIPFAFSTASLTVPPYVSCYGGGPESSVDFAITETSTGGITRTAD
jgi:hypothetical protein